MEEFIGKRLGDRYLIKSVLGYQKGRRTFLAQDESTRSLVVIKLVLFGPDFTLEDLKLFERESETLNSLDHPAIPQYLGLAEKVVWSGKASRSPKPILAAGAVSE